MPFIVTIECFIDDETFIEVEEVPLTADRAAELAIRDMDVLRGDVVIIEPCDDNHNISGPAAAVQVLYENGELVACGGDDTESQDPDIFKSGPRLLGRRRTDRLHLVPGR